LNKCTFYQEFIYLYLVKTPTYQLRPTANFKKELKHLSKKYPSILEDVEALGAKLIIDPVMGESLGNGFYKIRVAVTSKGKGKSGGARLITNVVIVNAIVYLISIYDKSEKESMPLSELRAILKTIL